MCSQIVFLQFVIFIFPDKLTKASLTFTTGAPTGRTSLLLCPPVGPLAWFTSIALKNSQWFWSLLAILGISQICVSVRFLSKQRVRVGKWLLIKGGRVLGALYQGTENLSNKEQDLSNFSSAQAAEFSTISKCSEGVKKLLVSLRNVLF